MPKPENFETETTPEIALTEEELEFFRHMERARKTTKGLREQCAQALAAMEKK